MREKHNSGGSCALENLYYESNLLDMVIKLHQTAFHSDFHKVALAGSVNVS